MNRVFISHSSEDHSFVLSLAKRMKSSGIDVWVDDWEIKVGDSIVSKIEAGIEKSSFLCIIFSPSSLRSEWVKIEINTFFIKTISDKELKILPVLLDVDFHQMPILLRDIKGVRFNNSIIDDFSYQALIDPIINSKEEEILAKFQNSFFSTLSNIDNIAIKDKPSRIDAENIVDIIKGGRFSNYIFNKFSNFKWLELFVDLGIFSPENNPKPEKKGNGWSVAYWSALIFLENVVKNLPDNIQEQRVISEKILSIMQEVTDDCQSQPEGNVDNYRTWWQFTGILSKIPSQFISAEFLKNNLTVWTKGYFRDDLIMNTIGNELLPHLLESDDPEEKVIAVFQSILQFVLADGVFGNKEPRLVIDEYYLKDLFEQNFEKMLSCCGIKFIESILAMIESATDDTNKYLYFSLHDTREHSYDAIETLIQKTLQFVDQKIVNEPNKLDFYMNLFVNSQNQLLKKMGLWLIKQDISSRKIFLLDNKPYYESLVTDFFLYGEELRLVLENMSEDDAVACARIIDAVDSVENKTKHSNDQIKCMFYNALKHILHFASQYNALKDNVPYPESELTAMIGPAEGGWVSDKEIDASINVQELIENGSFWEALDSRRGSSGFESYPYEVGLSNIVKNNPGKILHLLLTDQCFKFDFHIKYIDSLLHGLHDLDEEVLGQVNWLEILSFFEQSYKKGFDNLISFNRVFRDAFDKDVMQDAAGFEPVFIELYSEIINDFQEDAGFQSSSFITDSINSRVGTTFEVIIRYAMFKARKIDDRGVFIKDRIATWVMKMVDVLQKKKLHNAFTMLGYRFRNLLYIDQEKMYGILGDSPLWDAPKQQAFLSGLLMNDFSLELFKNSIPLFIHAIDNEIKIDDNSCTKLGSEILRYYVWFGDDSDKLVVRLIANQKLLSKGVWWLWRVHENLRSKKEFSTIQERIFGFWDMVIAQYRKSSDENASLEGYKDSLRLICYADQLDEPIKKRILVMASVVREDISYYNLQTELLRFANDSSEKRQVAKGICEIILQITENKVFSQSYEKIQDLVRFIYEHHPDGNECPDRICELYTEADRFYLRELHNEFNP